jgi:hypothetical protein
MPETTLECPFCLGTLRAMRHEYDAASDVMEFAGFEPCRHCAPLVAAGVELVRLREENARLRERLAAVETPRLFRREVGDR